jgi:flagellar motility protein MotE (MotC chaperone)
VFRFRILPATIVIALLLMIVKIIDVTQGTEALNHLLITKVEAETSNSPPPKPELPVKPDAAKEGDKKPAAKADEAKKPDAKAEPAKKEEGKKEEPKKDGKKEEKKEGEKDDKKNPNVAEDAGDTVDHRYTNVEVELLQNLSRRRDELDRWQKNIEIKEEALNATEKRVNDKIDQIDAMKKEVTNLLAQYNEKEDAKIKSLVKIYESMKPKDAARIFDEVEMPILLLVIDKMSEKKTAPILADMDPKKAKQITVQLAEQRRVDTSKFSAAAAANPPPQPVK